MGFTATDFFAMAPQLVLVIGALTVLVAQLILRKGAAISAWNIAVLTLIIALTIVVFGLSDTSGRVTFLPRAFLGVDIVSALNSSFRYSGFSSNTVLLFLAIALLAILPMRYLMPRLDLHFAETYFLLLASVAGYSYAICSEDLITLFVALELGALPILVLLGLNRKSVASNEAALKYMLLSAFAIAFLLLGIALLYGSTGTLKLHDLKEIAPHFTKTRVTMLAYAFIFAGFFFKVTAFPMHTYAADVYEGATTIFVAILGSLSKIAAVFLAFKVVFGIHDLYRPYLVPLFTLAAVGSMFYGAFASLWSSNLKRILAYSSITNAGYMLCFFIVPANTDAGLMGTLKQEAGSALYIFAGTYAASTLMAMLVIAFLETQAENAAVTLENLGGLIHRHILLKWALAIALLSAMGIPPLAGFFGKFFLFRYLALSGNLYLAAAAALASGVSVYAYIRVIRPLFFDAPPENTGNIAEPSLDSSIKLSLYFILGAIVFFVTFSSFLYNTGIVAIQKIY